MPGHIVTMDTTRGSTTITTECIATPGIGGTPAASAAQDTARRIRMARGTVPRASAACTKGLHATASGTADLESSREVGDAERAVCPVAAFLTDTV